MPRNANGIYSLPPYKNPAIQGEVIEAKWANETLGDVATELTNSIAADGSTLVSANVPMNNFTFTGVGPAISPTQYARADQVQSFVFNIVNNVACPNTVSYTGLISFGIGAGTAIPTLMPIIFVPSVNNGGPSTLALNGGTPVPILNSDLSQLTAGQIKANRPYALAFLAGNWILVTNTIDIVQLNGVYLPKAGGTMSGALILSQVPQVPMEAANRQWVLDQITGGTAGVSSFNTRQGAVLLTSLDVTTALNYTPANAAGTAFSGNIGAPVGSFTIVNANTLHLVTTSPGSTGTVNIDNNTTQSVMIAMTGNITFTVTNPAAGNIIRILLSSTTGRTVTWPANTKWPLPTGTPPVIDAGSNKCCLVTMQWAAYLGAWFANYSVY